MCICVVVTIAVVVTTKNNIELARHGETKIH